MTAIVTPHTPTLMYVAIPYSANNYAMFSEVGGCTYDGKAHAWVVPIMRLPSIQALMECVIDPAVITAYHALLRRMLADFAASGYVVTVVNGKLKIVGGSSLMRECLGYHTVGIMAAQEGHKTHGAAIQRNTSQNDESRQIGLFPPVTEPTVSKGDRLIHAGIVNAKKAADKKATIVSRKRYARKS